MTRLQSQVSHECTVSEVKSFKVVQDGPEIDCLGQRKMVQEMLETFKEI